MPLHDFRCPECWDVYTDVNVPAALGARGANLRCPNPVHLKTTGKYHTPVAPPVLEWIPQIGRMDFGPSGGTGFKGFTIEEEIRGETQRIEIDSVHKLRQVERESEQRARNGEGRPLVWRDYQQTRSNGDVHTLSADPGDPHGVRKAVDAKKYTPHRGKAVTDVHGTL